MTENSDLDQVERFDSVADNYDAHIDRELLLAGGNADFFYQRKAEFMLKKITQASLRENMRLLDFGCGTGKLLRALHEQLPKIELIGYDPSATSIAVARQKLVSDDAKLKINFVQNLDGAHSSFDVVVAAGVFHHLAPLEWEKTVAQLASYLRPSGILFIFEHNPWSLAAQLIVSLSKVDQGAHLLRPTLGKRLFKKAGLRSVSLEYISFFPSFLGSAYKLEPYLRKLPLGAQYVCYGQL